VTERREPPSNARSLDARIRNLSRTRDIPEGRVRRLIAIVVIGQLLRETEVGVIKGASNIEVRLGVQQTRVSSDLDTVRRASLEDFRDQLAVALRDGWEGFTGVVADLGPIDAPVPRGYQPHRLQVKLSYRGGDFGTVTVEVAAEEVGGLERAETVASAEAADWFAEIGLRSPQPVPTLPLEHQIAQKLHACTAPDTDERVNERAHDLVDLQLALEAYGGEVSELRAVTTRLFRSRRGHPWPPTVTARDGWEERYAHEAERVGRLDVAADLDAAIAWANDLIRRIDASS
jgi:hypothetical protein